MPWKDIKVPWVSPVWEPLPLEAILIQAAALALFTSEVEESITDVLHTDNI